MTKNGLIKKLGTLAIAGSMLLASGGAVANAAYPAEFSWRNNSGNWMTPVKVQKYNDCKVFAAIGAVEAKEKIRVGDLNYTPDFSEQQPLCRGVVDYNAGGSPELVLEDIKNNGIVNESALPYVGPTSDCQPKPSNAEKHFIYSWGVIQENWPLTPVQNRETIKQALIEKGPLIANMYLGGAFDANGIYKCDSAPSFNHNVVITGYKDTGDIHTSYWEAKDSSGTTEEGYLKVGWDYNHPTVGLRDQCRITNGSPLYVEMTAPPIEPPTPDTLSPLVTIASPTSGSSYNTNTTPMTVGGSASDNVGVTEVTWVNNLGGGGNCLGTTNWNCGNIPLFDGVNNVTVTARDAANNQSTDTISLNYTPPIIPPTVEPLNLIQGTVGWSGARYGGDNLSLADANSLQIQCVKSGRNSVDKEVSFSMDKYSEVAIEAFSSSQQPVKIRLGYEAKNKTNAELGAFYLSPIQTLNSGDNTFTIPQSSFTIVTGANPNNYGNLEKTIIQIQCPQNYLNTYIKIRKVELK